MERVLLLRNGFLHLGLFFRIEMKKWAKNGKQAIQKYSESYLFCLKF